MFWVHFATSSVDTWVFLPPLVTFVLAYFGAMAGVTGAFLLLPFQMSILGYVSPGVSATNFLYNIVAIPFTVWRYTKDGRMNWPLAGLITMGSLPGIFLGYLARVRLLTDPKSFKPFAGMVLLYLAWRMGRSIVSSKGDKKRQNSLPTSDDAIEYVQKGIKHMAYRFNGRVYSFDPRPLFVAALLVGLIGGAYGIGGGAILAPFCITVLRLPVHSVAGASLFGTFVSSIIGVLIYSAGFLSDPAQTRPDLALGILFGIGGLFGGYLGARTQKLVPELPIKIGLFLILLFVSLRYLAVLFF